MYMSIVGRDLLEYRGIQSGFTPATFHSILSTLHHVVTHFQHVRVYSEIFFSAILFPVSLAHLRIRLPPLRSQRYPKDRPPRHGPNP